MLEVNAHITYQIGSQSSQFTFYNSKHTSLLAVLDNHLELAVPILLQIK